MIKALLVIFVLLFGFMLLGCDEEENAIQQAALSFEEQRNLGQNIIAKYENYLGSNTPQEAGLLIVRELLATKGIESAGINTDNSIWWIIKDGPWHVFLDQTNIYMADAANQNVTMSPIRKSIAESRDPVYPHNNDALILSPFERENFGENASGKERTESFIINEFLREGGYKTTYVLDEEINMARYENFNDYGVIVLITHSGLVVLEDIEQLFICTGIKVPNDEIEKDYKGHIYGNKDIGYVWIMKGRVREEDTELYYAFNAKFLENLYGKKRLKSTFFYISGCNALSRKDIANAISLVSNKSVYLGWTDKIGSLQTVLSSEMLFTQLITNASSCGKAVREVKSKGYPLNLSGEENFYLIKNCQSFPPLPGETWTYRVTWRDGRTYTQTDTTEEVAELVGGYIVYRVRSATKVPGFDFELEPPSSGIYIGCYPDIGEFVVATTSYNVGDLTGESVKIHLEANPQEKSPLPRYFFTYGTPIGTTMNLKDSDGFDLKCSVESYEDVIVPYDVFGEVMKIKLSFHDPQVVNPVGPEIIYLWIDPDIGQIKKEDTGIGETLELMDYSLPEAR